MNALLNRIIIYSGNTLELAQFYRDHFGLIPIGEPSAEWAELSGGNCRLAFHQAYAETGPITTPTGSGTHPHKIVFTVSDVKAMRQMLLEKGVSIGEVQNYDEINLLLADGTDPEGHVFQICNR